MADHPAMNPCLKAKPAPPRAIEPRCWARFTESTGDRQATAMCTLLSDPSSPYGFSGASEFEAGTPGKIPQDEHQRTKCRSGANQPRDDRYIDRLAPLSQQALNFFFNLDIFSRICRLNWRITVPYWNLFYASCLCQNQTIFLSSTYSFYFNQFPRWLRTPHYRHRGWLINRG